jgi:hypothetical protein
MKWLDERFETVQLTPSTVDSFADVNIEIAHVSASLAGSNETGDEIAACIRRYRHIVNSREYGIASASPTTVCLVDDYNHVRPADFGDRLTRHVDDVESFGMLIDYIAFEADLELLKDEFLAVNRDERIVRYIAKNHRSPCSAHIAIWYLARLGKLGTPLPAFRRRTSGAKPFFANQILSILPRYYDTFEERAAIILERSTVPDIVSHINHAYFDADPPANLEYVGM